MVQVQLYLSRWSSLVENRVLKSPTIIALLCISSFRSVSICSIYLGALMLDPYIFIIDISSWWIELTYLSVSMAFFVSCVVVVVVINAGLIPVDRSGKAASTGKNYSSEFRDSVSSALSSSYQMSVFQLPGFYSFQINALVLTVNSLWSMVL